MPYKNPDDKKQSDRRYYQEHKEEHNEHSKVYRQTHKEEIARYYEEHREEHKENLRIWAQKIRLEILQKYSGEYPKCAHCGTDDLEVLTIDHINNDGAEHRRSIKLPAGTAFYYWLRNNSYPKGFQVLCRNCNYKKLLQHRRDLRK